MASAIDERIEISQALVEAIRNLPTLRSFEHCGKKHVAHPFEIYARCSECGTQIKLRSYSGALEIEDVFDAVFEWMTLPGAMNLAQSRIRAIQADGDEG